MDFTNDSFLTAMEAILNDARFLDDLTRAKRLDEIIKEWQSYCPSQNPAVEVDFNNSIYFSIKLMGKRANVPQWIIEELRAVLVEHQKASYKASKRLMGNILNVRESGYV